MSALDFSAGTSSHVNAGTASSLDGLTSGTILIKVMVPAGWTTADWVHKNAIAGGQNRMHLELLSTSLLIRRDGSSSDAFAQATLTNFAAWGTDKWLYVGAKWNFAGGATTNKLFMGDASTRAAEPSSYVSQLAGSGTIGNCDDGDLFLGRDVANLHHDGPIEAIALFNGTVLTDDQIRGLQYERPSMWSRVGGITGLWLMGMYGTSVVPDMSGNGNHGTASSVSLVPGPSGALWTGGFGYDDEPTAGGGGSSVDWRFRRRFAVQQFAEQFTIMEPDFVMMAAPVWYEAVEPAVSPPPAEPGYMPVGSRLIYVEQWTDYEGAGGTRERFFPVPQRCVHTDSVDGADEVSSAWPKTLPNILGLVRGKIVRYVFEDTHMDQEVAGREVSGGPDTLLPVKTVGVYDRLRRIPIRQSDADGFVYSDVPVVQLSPSSILSAYILANAPSWIVPGTVTPTALTEYQFAQDNGLSGLVGFSAAEGYEYRTRRVTDTQHAVDIVMIGSGVVGPTIRDAQLLRSIVKREGEGDPQVTIAEYVGPEGDDRTTTLAWAYWLVTGVASNVATVKAIHDTSLGPVGFNDQGTDVLVSNAIANCDVSVATLIGPPSVSRAIARSGLAGFVMHRIWDTDGAAYRYLYWTATTPANGALGCYVILQQPATPPATFNGIEVYDDDASAYRGALEVTWSGGVPTVTPTNGATGVTTTHLGDGIYKIGFYVTGCVAGNVLHCRAVPAGGAPSATGQMYYGYFLIGSEAVIPDLKRPWYVQKVDGTVAEVLDTDATTQEVTVGYVTGLAVNDRIRFVANGGLGHLVQLEDPAALLLYGDRRGLYQGPWDDRNNKQPNALFTTYTNPSARPDGYSGTIGTWLKETGTNLWLTGGQSAKVTASTSTVGGAVMLQASWSEYINKRKSTYSARIYLRPTNLSNGQIGFRLTVNGSPVGEMVEYRNPLNQWRNDIRIEGLNLSAHEGTSITLGFQLLAVPDSGSTVSVTAYVDAVCVGPTLASRPIIEGSNPARGWLATNEWLAEHSDTPYTVDLTMLDLGRDGSPYVEEVPLGGTIALDVEEATDDSLRGLTLRVLRRDRDLLDAKNTTVQVGIAPPKVRNRIAAPKEPVLPFFEPVYVQAAVRDNRQAVMLLKAEITATSNTQVTVTLRFQDSQGATTPQRVSYTPIGASYVSGTGLGPYVFTRPLPTDGMGGVVFNAELPGRSPVAATVYIPEQDTWMPSVQESIVETDVQGTLTITITDDPEGRVSGVKFATQQGTGAMGAFGAEDTSVPYSQSVTFVEKQPSKIAYQVIGKNSDGTTGSVLLQNIVTLRPSKKPGIPNVNADVVSKSGDVRLVGEGDVDTASLKYATSTTSMPADLTVDAATATNARELAVTLTAALAAIDGTLYIKMRAYSAADGGGVGSEYAELTIRRDTTQVTKTLRVQAHSALPHSSSSQHQWDTDTNVVALTPFATDASSTTIFHAALPVPVDVTITAWRARMSRANTSCVALASLIRVSSDLATNIATATHSGTGYATVAVTGLSETASSGRHYKTVFELRSDTSGVAADARIEYFEIDYVTHDYEETY